MTAQDSRGSCGAGGFFAIASEITTAHEPATPLTMPAGQYSQCPGERHAAVRSHFPLNAIE
jgi:hypothetical protein